MGGAAGTVSPLVFDLDGDGVETRSINDGINFDHDGNGFAEATGWVGRDDGFLVLDRNGNGQIDDGTELFGTRTPAPNGAAAYTNGFLSLAALDLNADGKIDSSDTNYANLRVWRDRNGDARTQASELLSLQSLGISSISTAYIEQSLRDAQGNEHRQIGSFTRADGSQGNVTDFWFQIETAYTVDRNLIPVSGDVWPLPDVQGFGNVHDLWQAIARDDTGELRSLLADFAATEDSAARHQIVTSLLYAWVGVQDVSARSRGDYIDDARKLLVLEAFTGRTFRQQFGANAGTPDPGPAAADVLEKTFDGLAAYAYGRLMLQTHLKDIVSRLKMTIDGGVVRPDVSDIVADLQGRYQADPAAGTLYVAELGSTLRTLDGELGATVVTALSAAGNIQGTGFEFALALIGRNAVLGGAGADSLAGTEGDDAVVGLSGNDRLFGGEGNDHLQGNEHNDNLSGDGGADTLDGGTGNDYLSGDAGADVYQFGRGSGEDRIYNYDSDAVGVQADSIVLGAGIATSGVTLSRYSDDLIIRINGTDDNLRVQSYFNTDGNSAYAVENLKFADGTVWNVAAVKTKLLTGSGSPSINVNGTSAADNLVGGLGNDYLYGQAGNDTLDGGAGNDVLDGGVGNDVYRFGRGSGKDSISAYDGTVGKLDVIQLSAGVSTAGVTLRNDGGSLVLSINGTADTLRVNSYFTNDATYGYQIEQIRFADGTVWDVNAVKARVLAGSSENDTLYGYASADSLSGLAGDDTVYARAGNDTVDGGAGEDRLYGEDGDDLIRGGAQDDYLYGDAGADNLQGQDGEDILYGQAGNDTLDGGAGNDVLDGGTGNDIYMFCGGGGADRISEYDTTAGNTDLLSIGAGVSAEQLWFRKLGSDLEISIIGTADRVTVANWYGGAAYQVEKIGLADGHVLLASQVNNLVNAMATFAPPSAGQTNLPDTYRAALDPVLGANWN